MIGLIGNDAEKIQPVRITLNVIDGTFYVLTRRTINVIYQTKNVFEREPPEEGSIFLGEKEKQMMEDKEILTWREILQSLLTSEDEKKRVASALGVHTITLKRWIDGVAIPRSGNLNMLLAQFPRHREELTVALKKEFADFLDVDGERTVSASVPTSFYRQILSVYSTTASSLLSSTLIKLILTTSLEHLGQDATISLAQCVHPSHDSQKVRSLRVIATTAWLDDEEGQSFFWGAESLAGYTIMASHPMPFSTGGTTIADTRSERPEKRSLAFPVLRGSRVAGAFVVSKPHAALFTPAHCELIETFATLAGLAFNDADFYAQEDIALHILPDVAVQQRYLRTFRMRISRMIEERQRQRQPCSLPEVEKQAWQMIEEELLAASSL